MEREEQIKNKKKETEKCNTRKSWKIKEKENTKKENGEHWEQEHLRIKC